MIILKTVVGANPWVIHRNSEVSGEDVEHFRLERWLRKGATSDMGASPFRLCGVN